MRPVIFTGCGFGGGYLCENEINLPTVPIHREISSFITVQREVSITILSINCEAVQEESLNSFTGVTAHCAQRSENILNWKKIT